MWEVDVVRKIAESCGLKAHIREQHPGWAWAKGVYRGRSVQIDEPFMGGAVFGLAIMISIFNPHKVRFSLSYHPAPDPVESGLAVITEEGVAGHFRGEEQPLAHLNRILNKHAGLHDQIAQANVYFGLDVYPLGRRGELRLMPRNPKRSTVESWLILVDVGIELAIAVEEHLR
jgi:hypothetical protein